MSLERRELDVPFPPTGLSSELMDELKDFAQDHDFISLYREYRWFDDTWKSGFPNILRLELNTSNAAKNDSLTKKHVLSICEWGKLRNVQKVACPEFLTLPLYENDRPNRAIETDPHIPLEILQAKVRSGIGPTYLSKVLRFALPIEFGAVDSRIVRVMGRGDPNARRHDWLSLEARKSLEVYTTQQWYIPKYQPAWPQEYSKWINILRFLAHFLNSTGKSCPHPEVFVRNGMRERGIWVCADVEMALFCYASICLNLR